MKNLVFALAVLTVILVSGCITQSPLVCNKPYILVGDECCLDNNNNSVCDNDEVTTTTTTTIKQELKIEMNDKFEKYENISAVVRTNGDIYVKKLNGWKIVSWDVFKYQNGKWEELTFETKGGCGYLPCDGICDRPASSCAAVMPLEKCGIANSQEFFQWDQTILVDGEVFCNNSGKADFYNGKVICYNKVQVDPGKYKFRFEYKLSCLENNDWSDQYGSEIGSKFIEKEFEIVANLDKQTALEKLKAAGCWYDLSNKSECMIYNDPYWIIQAEGCGGKCKINAFTNVIQIDSNPMCGGALAPNECTTDADCSNRTGKCTSKYVCRSTSCIPSFD